jgi:hypothetical protein
VVETATLSPTYEPIVKIEYHYLFGAGDKSFYWHNMRVFGKVDAPPGSPTRIEAMNLAGKVPVGWALPCNKYDRYDSYYWSPEYNGRCPGQHVDKGWVHTGPDLPWLEVFDAVPPDRIMLYYDSRKEAGGCGAAVVEGWTACVAHLRCSLSRQDPGWWRVDDLTRSDKIEPGMYTSGG